MVWWPCGRLSISTKVPFNGEGLKSDVDRSSRSTSYVACVALPKSRIPVPKRFRRTSGKLGDGLPMQG